MIDLPINKSNTTLLYSSLFTPHTLLSKFLLQSLEPSKSPHFQPSSQSLQPAKPPILTIAHSLQTLSDPIFRFGSSLLFRCETDQSMTIPDSLSLPNVDKEDGIVMYILCTVVVKREGCFYTYKRIFSPIQSESGSSRLIYDLKTWSRWVCVSEEGWNAVSPKFLKSVCPYVLHYERVFF